MRAIILIEDGPEGRINVEIASKPDLASAPPTAAGDFFRHLAHYVREFLDQGPIERG